MGLMAGLRVECESLEKYWRATWHYVVTTDCTSVERPASQ
jgi:hypothetical protein